MTTILIAMVAMMLTAVSYGRVAALYPAAGSAYTYVGRGLNPTWALSPAGRCFWVISSSHFSTALRRLTIKRFFPVVPYAVLAAMFVGIHDLAKSARHPYDSTY